jgi:proprotein convertase subtilisin/kexin type 5
MHSLVCDLTCATCIGPYYNNCTSCLPTYLHINICLERNNIPNGYFPSDEDHLVKKCAPSCLQCSGFKNCSSCITGYLLYNEFCYSSCPAKTFYNEDNETCESMHLYRLPYFMPIVLQQHRI